MLQPGFPVDQASPGGGVDLLGRVVESPHGSALESDAVGIVQQTVEDGVAEGEIADDIVPVLDRDLAGEQGATAGVAVVEDFEEVVLRIPAMPTTDSGKPIVDSRPCRSPWRSGGP